MKRLQEKIQTFGEHLKNVHREAGKRGFVGIMKLLWKDLFAGRNGSICLLCPACPLS